MSLYGSAILERLHENSPATNSFNSFYKVFDNSVGEWLDNFDVDKFHEDLFLNNATGKWLDLHGEVYDVRRRVDESDEVYRERIIQHTLGELTPKLLYVDFDVDVYVDTPNFNLTNTLTSDNYYITDSGFIVFSDEEKKKLIEKSFVLNEAIKWYAP